MTVFQLPPTNLKWLAGRTIFLTKHGSQAYGTATPTSDTDYKGFCIEPPEYYLSLDQRFEQAEWHAPNPDMVIYSLRKFMKLAADGNPSVLEVLFTDPKDWVIGTDYQAERGYPIDAFETIYGQRGLFLSTKVRFTFSGYAISQLKRIKGHHRWLMSPPTHEPTRKEFGLPEKTVIPFDQLLAAEAQIKKELDFLYNLDLDLDEAGNIKVQDGLANLRHKVASIVAGANNKELFVVGAQLGFDTNFLLLLDHERTYKNARIEWDQFNEWKRTRNPQRAELEAKWGYDTKHAMHLVRLMRMGLEILEGDGVLVKRPDAEELLEIRAGDWTYEELIGWTEHMENKLAEAYVTSKLPKVPDRKRLDALCQNIYESYNHVGSPRLTFS